MTDWDSEREQLRREDREDRDEAMRGERPCLVCGGSGVVGRGPDEGNCPMCEPQVGYVNDTPFEDDDDEPVFPLRLNAYAAVLAVGFVLLALVLGWVGR